MAPAPPSPTDLGAPDGGAPGDGAASPATVRAETARRRTFAIISHPDAGKTTLTEKFLLYGGALAKEAGTVKARAGRRTATSDWMDLEQSRGISVTSAAVQFEYRGCVVNLLDTPGHRDFSEDTYRVLAACDAAIMVLDAAKGIEPQTLKLFEVCRQRQLPLITFVNKWDRPGLDALELVDTIEDTLDITVTPVTWPVGIAGDFRGVVDRATGTYTRFTRTARGATMAPEEIVDIDRAATEEGDAWQAAADELALLSEVGADVDPKAFLAGEASPTLFGSALTNFGVQMLLDTVIDLVPAPGPRPDDSGHPRPVDTGFSGYVFKVQANMDPAHRDRIAFFRVCSGEFRRGVPVTLARTNKPLATKYAHQLFGAERQTVDTAYPGDIVGLVNATDVRVGDTLYAGEPVAYAGIPSFAPEHFATVRTTDTSKFKQFRRGVAQLDEEGVVQVLRHPDTGDVEPVFAAVGPMQFEVAVHRLTNEFGAPVELRPTAYRLARRTDAASAAELRRQRGVAVLERADGTLLAVFESPHWVARLEADHPELTLERLVAEGAAG